MDSVIVSKFGEYTVAAPERIKRAAEIMKANPSRRFALVTAPGRQHPDDIKITDLLFLAHSQCMNGENFVYTLAEIQGRFTKIIQALEVDFNIEAEIADLKKNLFFRKNLDYVASRGEHIVAKIFAKYLGWEFIDASKLIIFNKDGTFNAEKSISMSKSVLSNVERAVIPSFYGSINGASIKTFAREDCDTTATIIATAVNADLLERWTEPKSIYVVDPSLTDKPLVLRHLTYGELVEMTYMGLEVVNDLALFQLRKSGIPMSIKLIDNPEDPGTLITRELPENLSRNVIACMVGRKSYRALHIERYGINKEVGFMQKLFNVFTRRNMYCEHCITGIHRVSLLIKHPIFDLRRQDIMTDLMKAAEPDSINIDENISLIMVIGDGISSAQGTFTKIFNTLANAEIKISLIDQNANDLSIILGVDDDDYERAMKILYDELILGECELS